MAESRSLIDTWTAPGLLGTDLTRLRGSYRQAVTLFTEELDFLSDIDKTWIMGRGIAEWSAGRCRQYDTLPR